MNESRKWVTSDASGVVPIDFIANVEEAVEEMEFESSDEDYSYDEDEEGNIVRRKSKYPRFDPHIFHTSVWGWFLEAKKQFVKSIKRYGLSTKRSIKFLKSEEMRVRAKCGWPGCPWLVYGAKTSRCSRFQIITYEDEHHCAQNRENRLVSAKVIAERYEHFILANPMWKIDSIKATVLRDMFADVSISKCKAAKKFVMDKLMSGMKSEYTKIFDYQLELLRSNRAPALHQHLHFSPALHQQLDLHLHTMLQLNPQDSIPYLEGLPAIHGGMEMLGRRAIVRIHAAQ
ncbi:hypothetical protein D1007_01238 [Hordeum vulgare]|nr:hypothetical protein D1007_01238 [Hordeum vulgare]